MEFEEDFEEALANCSGSFSGDVFTCGAVGSEECVFTCPFSRDIGLSRLDIATREGIEDELHEDELDEESLVAYCRCGHMRGYHSQWDEQMCDLAFACRCAGFEADEY